MTESEQAAFEASREYWQILYTLRNESKGPQELLELRERLSVLEVALRLWGGGEDFLVAMLRDERTTTIGDTTSISQILQMIKNPVVVQKGPKPWQGKP